MIKQTTYKYTFAEAIDWLGHTPVNEIDASYFDGSDFRSLMRDEYYEEITVKINDKLKTITITASYEE